MSPAYTNAIRSAEIAGYRSRRVGASCAGVSTESRTTASSVVTRPWERASALQRRRGMEGLYVQPSLTGTLRRCGTLGRRNAGPRRPLLEERIACPLLRDHR